MKGAGNKGAKAHFASFANFQRKDSVNANTVHSQEQWTFYLYFRYIVLLNREKSMKVETKYGAYLQNYNIFTIKTLSIALFNRKVKKSLVLERFSQLTLVSN